MTMPAGLLSSLVQNYVPPHGGAGASLAPQPIPNWTPPPGGVPPNALQPISNWTPPQPPPSGAPMQPPPPPQAPAIPLAPAMQTVLEALTRAHAQGNPHAATAIAGLARAVQHGAQR